MANPYAGYDRQQAGDGAAQQPPTGPRAGVQPSGRVRKRSKGGGGVGKAPRAGPFGGANGVAVANGRNGGRVDMGAFGATSLGARMDPPAPGRPPSPAPAPEWFPGYPAFQGGCSRLLLEQNARAIDLLRSSLLDDWV